MSYSTLSSNVKKIIQEIIQEIPLHIIEEGDTLLLPCICYQVYGHKGSLYGDGNRKADKCSVQFDLYSEKKDSVFSRNVEITEKAITESKICSSPTTDVYFDEIIGLNRATIKFNVFGR